MKNIHRYFVVVLILANILLLIYTHGIGVSYDLTSLVETDPVRYVYQAKQILENGRMPKVDTLRSSPLGERTSGQLTFYPYVIASIYRAIKFTGVDFEKFVIALPIIFLILSIGVIYLMVWRVFSHKVALLSINILVVTPPLLVRTYAGFADRDGLALLLSMLAFLFYIQSYLGTGWKQFIFRLLSSVLTLCIGLAWQGVGLFVSIVVTLELVRIIVDEHYNKRIVELLAFWVLPVILGLSLFKPDIYWHLDQPYAFIAILYPTFILFATLLLIVFKRLPLLEKFFSINHRISARFGVFFLLGLVCIPLTFDRISNALIPSLTNPLGKDAVLQMIGELQKLGLEGWKFWPGVFLIPMTVGLLIVSRNICRPLNLSKYWVSIILVSFVFGIAFSRLVSGYTEANFSENFYTLGIYFLSMTIGILGLLIVYLCIHFKNNMKNSLPIEDTIWVKIFFVIWTLLMLIALRAAVRFVYLFVIPCTILGSYAIIWYLEKWTQNDKQNWLYIVFVVCIAFEAYSLFIDKINNIIIFIFVYILLACIALLVALFIVRFSSKQNLGQRTSIVCLIIYVIALTALSPHIAFGGYAFHIRKGLEMPQIAKDPAIEKALTWIRDNTPQDSVIAADWEHGAWLNLLSNRATIVDEQQRLKWVHQMAENVFMANNDMKNALEFLNTHEADYLLLTQRNISILDNIAKEADVNYSAQIPVFGNVVQDIHLIDKVMGIDQPYYRYWLPDWQQYAGDYQLRLGDKIYPPNKWYITSIYIQNIKSDRVLSPIKAVIELNLDGTIIYLPPESINYNNVVLNVDKANTYLPCTLLIDSNQSKNPQKWHVVYLSPQIRSLLAIRLFVFNELGAIFERVYPPSECENPSEYAAQVWKIHYPPGIKTRPEYLEMGSLAPTNF